MDGHFSDQASQKAGEKIICMRSDTVPDDLCLTERRGEPLAGKAEGLFKKVKYVPEKNTAKVSKKFINIAQLR